MKRLMILILAICVLLLAGCRKKNATSVETAPQQDTQIAETVSKAETVAETTNSAESSVKETVPAQKDATKPTQKSAESSQATKPTEAPLPTGPVITDEGEIDVELENAGSSSGYEESIVVGTSSEYERYLHMSPEEQEKYMESFESVEAFFSWYMAERDAYNAVNPPVILDGSSVDLENMGG